MPRDSCVTCTIYHGGVIRVGGEGGEFFFLFPFPTMLNTHLSILKLHNFQIGGNRMVGGGVTTMRGGGVIEAGDSTRAKEDY